MKIPDRTLYRRRSSNYVHELKMCQVWRLKQDNQVKKLT